jgi:hypothetical protein
MGYTREAVFLATMFVSLGDRSGLFCRLFRCPVIVRPVPKSVLLELREAFRQNADQLVMGLQSILRGSTPKASAH